jgi:hypothetical protein
VNPLTTNFSLYVDDLSGNAVVPISVNTPAAIVANLTLGHSYGVSVSALNVIGESA